MNLYDYVKKAKNNDKDSIEYLIEKFNPLFSKYAAKLEIPEDGKSELMMNFIKVIEKIPLEKETFKEDKYIVSYVNTSVRRHFAHLYTIQKNKTLMETSTDLSEIDFPGECDESNMVFYDLIKTLKPKEQMILERKYIYGLTNSEIACSLNISRQNVQACLTRAFSKLKKSVSI